jgi:NADPH:quinone reductase
VTAQTTRTVRFHEAGEADVLRIEDMPIGPPGPGEVRVAVQAIGLNRAEIAFRSGRYLERPVFPSRLGYEAAGIVEALGEGVAGFATGDLVGVVPLFSQSELGTYAEALNVPVRALVRAPEGIDAPQFAAVWMQYLTAYGMIVDIGGATVGDHVLIPAASSSVGLAAIQICHAVGAVPIAVTRTDAKRAALIECGASYVIASAQQDLPAEVKRITGGAGARLILDPVAGPYVATLAKAAAPGGVLFVYGGLSGQETPFPGGLAMLKGLSVRGYTLFEITQDAPRLEKAKRFVLDGLASKSFVPRIDRIFPFDGIADAHRYIEAGDQIGKVLVEI